mgnify:CR=1 FL=1
MGYTRKYAEGWFRRLAEGLGKDIAEGDNFRKIGAWELDYNSVYGGAIIEEVCNEGRGMTRPLIEYRLKPFEFGVMCQAILKVHSWLCQAVNKQA